jgi:hypothetical protein
MPFVSRNLGLRFISCVYPSSFIILFEFKDIHLKKHLQFYAKSINTNQLKTILIKLQDIKIDGIYTEIYKTKLM